MAQVTTLIERQSKKALVRARREHNLAKSKPPVTRERFWQAMVSMRLTTRQKSGPESFVARLIREKLFPLGYKAVLGARHPEVFIAKVLRAAGGIRFTDKIASELSQNFQPPGNQRMGTYVGAVQSAYTTRASRCQDRGC